MHRPLTRRRLTGAGALLIAAAATARAAEPPETHLLAQLVELTGPLAEAGDAWRNGVELAVQEINAAGGVLGAKFAVTTYDAGSSASAARYAAQKALEIDPLVVLGPALSEPARGVLALPRPRGTAVILGGSAGDLTGAAHPATFRTLPSAAAMMGRLAGWLRADGRAPRLAVLWSGHDPYRSSRDALAHEARAVGIDIAAEWVTESLSPASDISRLLTANPDLLVVLLPPDKAGRVVAEARKLAPRLPLLGEASLVAPAALAAAGAAAEGLRAHVLLPPDDKGFAARYLAANRQPPDELAFAGYLAVGMVKAGLEKASKAEPAALAEALHGLSVTADPMLGDCTWNEAGDPDRASWIVEVRDGKLHTLKMLREG
jgi:branched-chain amino acid transport system substrate-binding protein